MIKIIALTLATFFSSQVLAENKITQIYAKVCPQGIHEQPSGQFAIHVFCDDALGTNIAVFLNKMGAPIHQEYDLGNRFWQNEEWAYDVMSFAWLSNKKLLLSTSAIYGTGSIYLLDPSQKQSKVLLKIDGALIELVSVKDKSIEVRYQTEFEKYEYKTIDL
ncbi:MAG: hypothetical protein COA78_25655 [Blastopirellula sp.]|nr:MAG: hypothetical protein COA78_25655 [Blastopirellula sp.]